MTFFARKRFVWNEPWFFQQRIRTPTSWFLLSLLLLAVAGIVGAALYFAAPAGKPINLFEIVGMSLAAAAALWWVLDGAESRRQAVLFQDSIVVGGDMGKYSYPTTYKLSEIPRRGDRHAQRVEVAGARLVLSLRWRRASDRRRFESRLAAISSGAARRRSPRAIGRLDAGSGKRVRKGVFLASRSAACHRQRANANLAGGDNQHDDAWRNLGRDRSSMVGRSRSGC